MSKTYRRGDTSEFIVHQAIEELVKEEGTLAESGVGRILRFKHARPNSDLDQKHVDFLVLVETPERNRVPVPINVKSSERKRREFEEAMNRQKLPHIRSIAVKAEEDLEKVKAQVIQCLRAAIQMFHNGYARVLKKFTSFLNVDDGRLLKHRPHKPSSKTLRWRRDQETPPLYYYVHQARHCH